MAEFSKSALDRLGERLRSSAAIADADRAMYDAYRASFAPAVVEVESLCADAIPSLQARTARLKTLESTIAKLRRGTFRLSQVQDIAGVRLAVRYLSDQDEATDILTSASPAARTADYREEPQNGYRAVHVIVAASDGRLVEVQVRTEVQDIWANTCEQIAGMVDLAVKYGGGPDSTRSALELFSELGRALDRSLEAGLKSGRALQELAADLRVVTDEERAAHASEYHGLERQFAEWVEVQAEVDTTNDRSRQEFADFTSRLIAMISAERRR